MNGFDDYSEDELFHIIRQLNEKLANVKLSNPNDDRTSEELSRSEEKALKNIEVHESASLYLEYEVSEYKRDLQKISKVVARTQSEKHIITKSNIREAKNILWSKKSKISFYDASLSFGSALLGISFSHIVSSFTEVNYSISLWAIIIAVLGGIIFGIGANGKT